MRLREITSSNNVILALTGLKLDFSRELSTATAIARIMVNMGVIQRQSYRQLLEKLLEAVDSLLSNDQLDRTDPDIALAMSKALFAKQAIRKVIDDL